MNTNDQYIGSNLDNKYHQEASLSKAYSDINDESLLSVCDLANLFKVHVRTAQRWTKCNKIPHFRIGSVIRYKKDDVLRAAEIHCA